ncbi:hypothetical protein F2P56_014604 [Juglans regia]|uniref:Uncharacterized protein LOC108979171 n=2 Tax=Juglans regia TaxID=51240 RepID=A0A2I4DDU6_JUGRE|nr:uncharacterized protein LOC108979171 [Juglans regia]KAF5464532.1 hypothetical protein F2P56_014604 [Juglans regia]
MWAVSPTTARPYLFPLTASTPSILAGSRPPCHRSKPPKDVKGLGRTIFMALTSSHPNASPYPISNQQKQEQEDGGQISGSDVLWALQKAAAQKNEMSENKKSKKKKKKKGVSSNNHSEEVNVDYRKVRPLCVKSEWGARLEELEKRLQELSETH